MERSARTTIVICLDGDDCEVREDYREGIRRVKEWCEGRITVDLSDLFGPGCKVVTTRVGGALHLELKYKGRSITLFLIQGRNLYIRGWRCQGKVFELVFEDQEDNFTLDRACIKLKTGANYRDLIGGVKNVPTGLIVLRKAFDKLWRHAGGENINISEEIAIVTVHIAEASRFPPILGFICESFTNLEFSRLGKDPSNCNYVTKYKKASGAVMENIDRMKAGETPLPIKINGLENKTILFRDGYNAEKSNFEHENKPSPPIYENTMTDIGPGVQRKRKCAQQAVNMNKRSKGGGGPKGGSMGGGSMQGGQGRFGGSTAPFHSWPKGGGFGGSAAPFHSGPNGGGFGGSAAPFHSGTKGGGFGGSAAPFHSGPKGGGFGGSATSFHCTGRGPKDGVGRTGVSFHHTREGLKALLDQDQHAVPSSIGMGERACLRTAPVRHFELPRSSQSHKYISAKDQVLAHRKMQFPTSPLPIKKTSPSLFSLLAPYSSLLMQKNELRAFPQLFDHTSHHHSRLSLSGLLKTRYISRALRFIH